MRSFESGSVERIDIERAYERAREALDKEAIQPGQFVDLYGEETVNRDEEHVRKLEAKFEEDSHEETLRLATVLEAIFHQNAELNNWLGPDATTIKTSRYDDIVNGVDDIAEFREGEARAHHLALAIDVTFSPHKGNVFERIREEIESGTLAKIKYFRSEHMGIRGEMTNVPRVVIGADVKTVRELSELWLAKDNEKLANHPIQFQILEEMVLQLEAFEAYARKVGQTAVAASYKKMRLIVEEIYRKKQLELKDDGSRDSVFEAIRAKLRRF